MPQELDEVEGPEDLIEGDLEELEDDELIEEDPLAAADAADADEDGDDAEATADGSEEEALAEPAPPRPAGKADESDEDEEEEPDDEDVEASLDTILKERLVVEEPEDDEETVEVDDRSADALERVLPKQPGEFVCRSCFLVKHPNQLADAKHQLCRDCV
jgi:Domain of unknown function (DUF4193)